MLHPSIRLEGSILSADILDAIERGDRSHQAAKDFGLDPTAKVKDEIADAWASARAYWAAYQVKISRLREGATGTTETRNQWMVPLLGLLGYQLSLSESETIQGKTYRISHRDITRDQLPVHLIGWYESLDRRSTVPNAPRMSPHGLLQEYINLTEHLYGIVSNGRLIRLLRDSSRLVKLTFIEFDLERIFTEELFADFALLYRLLHASRLPVKQDAVAEAPIEIYHQDSLDSGSRIRDGLSTAVHDVILSLGNGFLNHTANARLRELAGADTSGRFSMDFYAHLLRLIYRLLFLMVIEERGLAHVPGTDKRLREIYDLGYSLARLRRLAEKPHFAEARHLDAWLSLIALFRLVDESGRGLKLGVAPLGGDLFNIGSLGVLEDCCLDNATLLGALRQLTLFTNPVTHQLMRVNYGALNVEEFGSVYQGLLEFAPKVTLIEGKWRFSFALGNERSRTGSHYTPEELVQPLIKHSLANLIADCLQKSSNDEKQKALLALRVCDVACGSGHILLAAARRIATELAIVRTGEDQPSPLAFREAVRDVIRHCIYGVDLNPLAVELCKVALWLEAHLPGESLNFLDHHIKCGNAIVGLAHEAELQRGILEEAFNRLPDDDKDIASEFRKRNQAEKKEVGQQKLDLAQAIREELRPVSREYSQLAALPDHCPTDYEHKKAQFAGMSQRRDIWRLRTLANLQVAQFFIPKTPENKSFLCTEEEYRDYLTGKRHPQSQAVARANALAVQKHWFHWFIEFPDVFDRGGFDCIIGNPPYLGGKKINEHYGETFQMFLRAWLQRVTGQADLVTYFVRRIFELLPQEGFCSLITTNTISEGDTRESGLDIILNEGGEITFASKSVKWPGQAAVYVTLLSLFRGRWSRPCILNGRSTLAINAYIDEDISGEHPKQLAANLGKAYEGIKVYGDGFVLDNKLARELITKLSRNQDVVFPYLSGSDLYTSPLQKPTRWVINFHDWPEARAAEYADCYQILYEKVRPERLAQNNALTKAKWWLYERARPDLVAKMKTIKTAMMITKHSKSLAVAICPTNMVFSNGIIVFPMESFAIYALLQSNLHSVWAWSYGSRIKTDLRYTPSDCFETFPFPKQIDDGAGSELVQVGELYHEHRREIMLKLQVGLTKTYNLFHDRELSVELVAKDSKQPVLVAESAHADLLQLRNLHVQMDKAVLAAYGWHQPSENGPALALRHDFYEVDYLPENDRVRYTIHPDARKEILKRLLQLNHKLYAEEESKGLHKKKAGKMGTKAQRKKSADELL